jgi:hypothetical protein
MYGGKVEDRTAHRKLLNVEAAQEASDLAAEQLFI